MTIRAVETDLHAGASPCFLEGCGEAPLDLLPRCLLGQCEIQILREAIVAEVTLLECRPTLESQPVAQRAAGEPDQEPRKTVVALEKGLRDAPASLPGETIGKKREIPLRNHRSGPHDGAEFFRVDVQLKPPAAEAFPPRR